MAIPPEGAVLAAGRVAGRAAAGSAITPLVSHDRRRGLALRFRRARAPCATAWVQGARIVRRTGAQSCPSEGRRG